MGDYQCQRCGTKLQGDAALCVLCYDKVYRPCPNCTVQTRPGRYTVRLRGRRREPMDCQRCHNARWIQVEDYPKVRAVSPLGTDPARTP